MSSGSAREARGAARDTRGVVWGVLRTEINNRRLAGPDNFCEALLLTRRVVDQGDVRASCTGRLESIRTRATRSVTHHTSQCGPRLDGVQKARREAQRDLTVYTFYSVSGAPLLRAT